jgi:hypothetical protein
MQILKQCSLSLGGGLYKFAFVNLKTATKDLQESEIRQLTPSF